MMKSIILSGVVASMLMFSGCADKAPIVDTQVNNAQEVEAVETETVSSENSNVNEVRKTLGMSDYEAKLSSVYFDFDQFSIKSSMKDSVSTDAALVNGDASAYGVKLEGNCDEWGSDEYNFALGLKRANAVKKELVANGVPESRISMVSYGESNPACSNKTQDCWSKNRRVDFTLLP